MKKKLWLILFLLVLTLSSCSNNKTSCGKGTTLKDGVCVIDEKIENETGIRFVSGSKVTFNLGDPLPDFSTYFTLIGVEIDNSMIAHSLPLDTSGFMNEMGVYAVVITVGNDTKTISVAITDPSIDYTTIIVEGEPGIYVDNSRAVEFEIGDYMPNFLTYFIAYDGEGYVHISPDKIIHSLSLSADNRMIQAGTYQVSAEVIIMGVTYKKSVSVKVNTLGGASIGSIGKTGWAVINAEFNEPNLFDSWFIPSGDVTLGHNQTAGFVDVRVNTVGMNFWDVLFAQPGKTFEKGYTYEITYRMRTGIITGRDVVLFVEASSGSPKLLEEQVSLTTIFQDYSFTFNTSTSTTNGMIGVFIGANLPGADPGSVIFDSIKIIRSGKPLADVYLNDMPNQNFSNSNISSWVTEGNVSLTHDTSGYLLANVEAFTGQFYQENIQLGGLSIKAGITYTVSYTLKSDFASGRNVVFFVEDTDAGYAKYFEETKTLTSDFKTFTFSFTPTANNEDTKVGIFLGAMANGLSGMIVIDSIIITTND